MSKTLDYYHFLTEYKYSYDRYYLIINIIFTSFIASIPPILSFASHATCPLPQSGSVPDGKLARGKPPLTPRKKERSSPSHHDQNSRPDSSGSVPPPSRKLAGNWHRPVQAVPSLTLPVTFSTMHLRQAPMAESLLRPCSLFALTLPATSATT